MKIPPTKADNFLSSVPQQIFGVLLYGPNKGLVSLRAETLYTDWFNCSNSKTEIIKLEGADILKNNSLLFDNLNSMSLISNLTIISISNCSGAITKLFKEINFSNYEDIKIIIKNDEMGPRSSLRTLFENNALLASLPCYEDGLNENISFIKETFIKNNLVVPENYIEEIANYLSTDRLINKQELNKFITYINGNNEHINSNIILMTLSASNDFSLENISYSVGGGQKKSLLKNLKSAYMVGTSPISIIRSCNYHFERLLFVKQKIGMHLSLADAMNLLKPRVFFKKQNSFIYQVNNWNLDLLFKATSTLLYAELLCKKNSSIANIICEQALLSISTGFSKKSVI